MAADRVGRLAAGSPAHLAELFDPFGRACRLLMMCRPWSWTGQGVRPLVPTQSMFRRSLASAWFAFPAGGASDGTRLSPLMPCLSRAVAMRARLSRG